MMDDTPKNDVVDMVSVGAWMLWVGRYRGVVCVGGYWSVVCVGEYRCVVCVERKRMSWMVLLE